MSRATYGERVHSWERATDKVLLVLALVFLVSYAWPILDPALGQCPRRALSVVSAVTWVAFGADYLVRVGLASPRRGYITRHWYEVPLIALPMLRPLRLLRLVTLAKVMNRSAASRVTGRVGVYVAGGAVAAVTLGALAELDAERLAPGARITTYGDAIWWACTTATTVGYGDYYPVTTTGRLVAVALMVVGIALVGSVTAIVAAWLIESVKDEDDRLAADRE